MPFSFTSSLVIESFYFRLLWWMHPRAASCRQDHRGKHDSSKTCHSSNQCFHGSKFHSHVAAWLGSVSIRFIVVPVGVFWTRLVSPDKLAYQRVPLQSDPNLSRPWGVFINQVQNKLVFFIAVDLHKIPPFAFAVRSSILPTFDCATHKVTVAFEMRPATGAGIYSSDRNKEIGYYLLLQKSKIVYNLNIQR